VAARWGTCRVALLVGRSAEPAGRASLGVGGVCLSLACIV